MDSFWKVHFRLHVKPFHDYKTLLKFPLAITLQRWVLLVFFIQAFITYSIASSGLSGSSYKLTKTLVKASMTPVFSKYFLNSSRLLSDGYKTYQKSHSTATKYKTYLIGLSRSHLVFVLFVLIRNNVAVVDGKLCSYNTQLNENEFLWKDWFDIWYIKFC